MVALNLRDKKRKRALMLFYAGKETHDIYNTLKTLDDEGYEDARDRLTTYFEPLINRSFEIYNFRKMSQGVSENIDNFHRRLKEAAGRCSFSDPVDEIKHQIIFGCRSDKLRRKALRCDTDLEDILSAERAYEIAELHASVIEERATVNKMNKPGR